LLRSRTRHDFHHVSAEHAVSAGPNVAWGIHRLSKIANYVRYLQENPQELDILFKEC